MSKIATLYFAKQSKSAATGERAKKKWRPTPEDSPNINTCKNEEEKK